MKSFILCFCSLFILTSSGFSQGSENALSFDGSSSNGDYIDCGSDNSIDNFFSGGATIEAWIMPTSGGGSGSGGSIVSKSAFTNGFSFRIYDESSGLARLSLHYEFSSGADGGIWHTNRVVPTNEWTHVTVAYDNSSTANNPVLYVNGISQSVIEHRSPAGSAKDDSDANLLFGNAQNNSHTFDGEIDEVRIWSSIRSANEIKDNMCKSMAGNEASLLGYWKINEGSGATVIADETTNGNDGTLF